MTVFACADAHGVVAYNGIGADDDGSTPSDWLLDLAGVPKLFDRSLSEVLSGIKTDLERRLRPFRSRHGSKAARHTFLFGVWQQGESIIYGLSNYERVDNDVTFEEGSETVNLSALPPGLGMETRVVSTGARTSFANMKAISKAVSDAPTVSDGPNRITARCIKTIRDVVYAKQYGVGSVSATVQWARVGKDTADIGFGHDVAGGSIAQETPNLINIGAQVEIGNGLSGAMGGWGQLVKGTYVGDARASQVAQYDASAGTVTFFESKCGVCGTPWPASHKSCEVCLPKKKRRKKSPRGKARNR